MILLHGSTSVIVRFKLQKLDGTAKPGLTSASAGLLISTATENEAAPTVYTQAAGNIEGIAALGTYAAPTAGKVRFKEYDAVNHPGDYEYQLADARFAIANARRLRITVPSVVALDLAQADFTIDLTRLDLYDSKLQAGASLLILATINAAGSTASVLRTSLGGDVYADADHFKNRYVFIRTGARAGQSGLIDAFDRTTGYITLKVGQELRGAPANGDTLLIS